MKWLWIGFALVWALSVVLDGRRRTRAPATVPKASPPEPPDEEPSVPALLSARSGR